MKTYKEAKLEAVQGLLLELGRKFINEENRFDASSFKKQHPKEYSRLGFYFGSITNFKEQLGCDTTLKGLLKRYNKIRKNNIGETRSVRNQLALEMLNTLMESQTFEEIGDKYGVSRQAIHELHCALKGRE